MPTTTTVESTTTQTVSSTTTATTTRTATVTNKTVVVVPPKTTTVTQTVAASGAAAEAQTISALLKTDLRQLLQPPVADLTTAKLAKTAKLKLPLTSPGSGQIKVLWKVAVPDRNKNKAINLVSYTGTLRKLGDITVTLPLTSAGRALLKGAKSATVAATVTYTIPKVGGLSVHRTYKLKG